MPKVLPRTSTVEAALAEAERVGRFAIFASDMAAIGALLVFAPISGGGEIPQNFVFMSSRHLY